MAVGKKCRAPVAPPPSRSPPPPQHTHAHSKLDPPAAAPSSSKRGAPRQARPPQHCRACGRPAAGVAVAWGRQQRERRGARCSPPPPSLPRAACLPACPPALAHASRVQLICWQVNCTTTSGASSSVLRSTSSTSLVSSSVGSGTRPCGEGGGGAAGLTPAPLSLRRRPGAHGGGGGGVARAARLLSLRSHDAGEPLHHLRGAVLLDHILPALQVGLRKRGGRGGGLSAGASRARVAASLGSPHPISAQPRPCPPAPPAPHAP